MRERGDEPGQKVMRCYSEQRAVPRRGSIQAAQTCLLRRQTQKGSEVVWDPIEFNGRRSGSGRTGITSQPCFPAEAIMGTLGSREDHRLLGFGSQGSRPDLHVYPLRAQQLYAGPAMLSPTPVTPEQGRVAQGERVEQHTHLTRLFGGTAVPLAPLTQGTGAAAVNTGCIHHTQVSIAFLASLVRSQRLPGRAAQRPIRLEGKVATREASAFPGQGHLWRAISLDRR